MLSDRHATVLTASQTSAGCAAQPRSTPARNGIGTALLALCLIEAAVLLFAAVSDPGHGPQTDHADYATAPGVTPRTGTGLVAYAEAPLFLSQLEFDWDPGMGGGFGARREAVPGSGIAAHDRGRDR